MFRTTDTALLGLVAPLDTSKALFQQSSDPAASGRGMEADLLPNSRFGLQASCFRRRAAGNLPVLD